MRIRVHLRTLWKHRWILATAMCAGAAMAIALAVRQPPVYLAEAQIFIAPDAREGGGRASDNGDALTAEELAPYATHIESLAMAQTVVRRESLDIAASELAGKVEVDVLAEKRVVSVGVADSNATQARDLANAFATAFVEEGVRQVGAESAQAEVSQPAPAPEEPVSPKPVRDGVIGLGLGALVGIFLMLVLKRPASKIPKRETGASRQRAAPAAPAPETPPKIDLRPASRSIEELELEDPGGDEDIEPPDVDEEDPVLPSGRKDPFAIYPATRTFLEDADQRLARPVEPRGGEDAISLRIRAAVRRGMTAAAPSEGGPTAKRPDSERPIKPPPRSGSSVKAKPQKQQTASSSEATEPDVEYEEFWQMGREHHDPAEREKPPPVKSKKKRPKA